MLTWSVRLKKCTHVKIILKNLTQKKNTKHTSSGYSLFTNCSFHATKNKLNCYNYEDCMQKFCKDLREHAMKIINYEKKEMILLTNEGNEYYLFHMQKKLILIKMMKIHLNYIIK